jgi:hypothetical protein
MRIANLVNSLALFLLALLMQYDNVGSVGASTRPECFYIFMIALDRITRHLTSEKLLYP